MRKRIVTIVVTVGLLLPLRPLPLSAANSWLETGSGILQGVTAQSRPGQALSDQEIGAGLKEALRVGSENVVRRLGAADGFNGDPSIHIPLPRELATVKSLLGKAGMGGLMDDLELRLNRAAEAATPKAKELFLQAITEMTIDDVKAIYSGPSDAATRYFQARMSPGLGRAMEPIVDQALAEAGAVQLYEQAMGKYRALPFVPDVKANLTGHVVEKGMAGIFYYIGREEAAIRENPAKRTSEILQKVFGGR